jgi:hypothetical protein
MNAMNSEYLKNQIDYKKSTKLTKMNDEEFKYNQKILDKIREGTENVRESINRNNINIDNLEEISD